MKKLTVCIAFLLAGCAKLPDEIKASDVAVTPYMQMSCPELASQRSMKQMELSRLEEAQVKTAKQDAAAMSIIHVPLASIRGHDRGPEIADRKGELGAIDQAIQAKACNATQPAAPAG